MQHLKLCLLQAHIHSHSNLRSLLPKQNLQWYLFFQIFSLKNMMNPFQAAGNLSEF
jgi:hypothetical protein